MRLKHLVITVVLLVAFTACDASLQKATQQLLTKQVETSTPAPQEPDPTQEQANHQDREEIERENCPEEDPHPIGESITKEFNVTYEEVMGWYCDGYIFEDILLALETSQMADVEPEELLQELDIKSWDRIWDELDIVDQGD